MDPRLEQAPVVAAFADAVRPVAGVLGFYCGGSLAMGDYRPGVSDLDLTAVVAAELDTAQQAGLQALHERFLHAEPAAAKLHCVYVPRDAVADLGAEHLTWAHGELYRRPLSGIARAELHQAGITVLGPPPADLLPAVDLPALRQAARRELTGYWATAVRRRGIWLQDVYVDLGLLTLARVEATLTEGRLITKAEAIGRLDRFGVPAPLAREIAHRRAGGTTTLTTSQRLRRAAVARRLVARGIRGLVGPRAEHGSA